VNADLTPAERRTRDRQGILITRALHAPEGLTAYAYTEGMTKADAQLFWADAKALGLRVVGSSDRGKLLALPSEVCD